MGPLEQHFCSFPFGGGGRGPEDEVCKWVPGKWPHRLWGGVVLVPTQAQAVSRQAHQVVRVHCRQRILRKARRKSWLKMV